MLITSPQHAGHQGWVKVIKCKVKVIKCKVKVIKCNVSVNEGMVNEVIEVRSLSVCCCCCYCCCCYYMSHVIFLGQGQSH